MLVHLMRYNVAVPRRVALPLVSVCLITRISGASAQRAGHHHPWRTHASMSHAYRQPIIFPTREQHKSTLIMLHGLGDTGDGWSEFSQMWRDELKHTKFIFPHAPQRPITLNMGMSMPGWFDISSLDKLDEGGEDAAGLAESARYVETLIAAEAAEGVPSDKIVVAGFSQGGAVAMMTLRAPYKLAGVVTMSGWLPLAHQEGVLSKEQAATQVLMCHGDADTVVQYKYGVESYERLKSTGALVQFKTYKGLGHSAHPQEIDDVRTFVKNALGS